MYDFDWYFVNFRENPCFGVISSILTRLDRSKRPLDTLGRQVRMVHHPATCDHRWGRGRDWAEVECRLAEPPHPTLASDQMVVPRAPRAENHEKYENIRGYV